MEEWLRTGMFRSDPNADCTIAKIIKVLNSHRDTKLHARHFSVEKSKEIGLKIADLENGNELQDLVLTIHHAYMLTFALTDSEKIIENQNGKIFLIRSGR